MKTSNRLLAIPVALILGACAGDAGETETDTAGSDPSASEQTAQTQAPAAHDMAAMPMTAQFRALQDSGVTGEATVTGRGEQTEVTVRLTGLAPNVPRPGHIHTGTCEAIQAPVQPLEQVSVDGSGTGTMTVTVNLPGNTVLNGQHIIVYHGEGGAPITCAAIPAHIM